VWEFIDNTNPEIKKYYWKNINAFFWVASEEDLIFGIDKLLEVNRFISALNIVYHEPKKLPSEKLIEVLENAGTKKSEEQVRLDSYHTTKIIEELEEREDVEKEVLLRLDWLYLPFLASYGSSHEPKTLHDELAKDPAFFIEVLSWIYKSDKPEQEETEAIGGVADDGKQNRAKNAYSLLNSWKQIPGIDENGNIDEVYLWNWITIARERARQIGRLQVADVHIGHILAQYIEKEEPWPPREICNVIETINTRSIKSGFSTATFNKRGSSTRGPFEGGEIERGHAKYFYSQAEAIKFEFPETAKVLFQLAKVYEQDAKRMDEIAERDRLDY